DTALRLGPVIAAVIFLAAYHVHARRSYSQVQLKVEDAFAPLGERLANVPNDLFGSYDVAVRTMLFVLALGIALGLVVARWREHEPRATRGLFALVLHYRFEVAGLVFVLGFFAAPSKWSSATLLYSRFAGPAWALLVLAAAPRSGVPRWTKP